MFENWQPWWDVIFVLVLGSAGTWAVIMSSKKNRN